MNRANQVLKSCVEQVIAQAGEECKAEQRLYQSRNYAQGKKMKPKTYLYLRIAEIKNNLRQRLQRLRIADVWIEELLAKQFKVCRKNSRGHQGISRN